MLRQLWQKVYWTDNDDKDKSDTKAWTVDWRSSTALRGGARVAEAVNKDKAWNWAEANNKDFTMHLFDSDDAAAPGGATYSVVNHKLKTEGNLESDISRVIAAVNLMDNPKYSYGNYNAYCVKGGLVKDHLWGKYYETGGCNVKFDNGAALAKMARGEKPTQEEMFNIESKSNITLRKR